MEQNEQLKTDFSNYLYAKGHTKNTTVGYVKVLSVFLKWLAKNHLGHLGLSYEQLLGFVKLKREKGDKVNTINQCLMVIRKFYTSLLQTTPGHKSILPSIQILEDLKLRGGTRYILYDLLSEEKLEEIYQSCPTENMVQIRNKCLLGMMIYQALHAGDICRIKLQDIDLEKATVFIASTRNSNERTLILNANQIIWLQKYLLGVRPGLLNYSAKGSSNKLFIGQNGTTNNNNMRGALSNLYQKLRRDHPVLKDIHQIRSSAIRHCLKKENIRVVQHKLGHRYVSSTQAYLEGDIESLQQQIDRLHPLNDQ